MSDASRRALDNHRAKMRELGLERYEVRGLAGDKPLIRQIARRLAGQDAAAARMRETLSRAVEAPRDERGGIRELFAVRPWWALTST